MIGLGMGLTVALVQIAKHATDRPRPGNALVDAAGSAYPSGHAAYAMAWIALAVVAVRVVPALRGRWWLVVAAIVLAALVGLTPPLPARALGVRRPRRRGRRGDELLARRDRGAGRRLRTPECRPGAAMSNESIIILVAACSGVFGARRLGRACSRSRPGSPTRASGSASARSSSRSTPSPRSSASGSRSARSSCTSGRPEPRFRAYTPDHVDAGAGSAGAHGPRSP